MAACADDADGGCVICVPIKLNWPILNISF
jgi:hypothetical protein